MRVNRLWLTDFRNYEGADITFAPDGLTVITAGNGEGKTNLLEAVGYLALLSSFRAAPPEALVRDGCDVAVVRAELEREQRDVLVEAEIRLGGRDRVQVNRQPLRRARDMLGALRVTVFSPDDLALVKGGPGERRRYLDDALAQVHRRNDALRSDLDRVIRQRNALLRQSGHRLDRDAEATLDVWDHQLAATGEAVASARAELVGDLEAEVAKAYDQVADTVADVVVRYERCWEGPLAAALAASRSADLRRGVTLVGPHRDELSLTISGLPARTHASQGEQRSLALALRLASHAAISRIVGEPPVLLLDDVFSELDDDRASALTTHLPPGQAILTTAHALPGGATAEKVIRVAAGRVFSEPADA